MKLSATLKDYLSSVVHIKSNILFTDLNKILLTYTNKLNDYFYNKPLGKDILELVDMWKENKTFDNNFIMLSENFKKIIDYDSIPYSAQMIFPIYHNNTLDGFLIFFRQSNSYVKTSSKALITIRNFTEIMSNNNFKEKGD